MRKIPFWIRAAGLGILLTGAQAPLNVWPATFVAFSLLLYLLDRPALKDAGGWRIFWIGWAFGFGNMVSGLYWMGAAMLVEAHKFWWAIPFAVAGLPAVAAIYIGLVVWLWHKIRRHFGLAAAPSLLLFAVLWSGGEWLRGHLLTGFPWLLVAYGWQGIPAFEQSFALMGAYGVGFVTVLVAGLPWLWRNGQDRGQDRPARILCAAVLAVFAGLTFWGAERLAASRDLGDTGLALRVVQPDIPEEFKIDPQHRVAVVEKLLAMSTAPAAEKSRPDLIIWPEVAISFFPQLDETLRARMAAIAPALPDGAILFGAPARDPAPDGHGYRYYNSLFAIDADGELRGRYDKAHLVPFGEYFPFRSWLEAAGVSIDAIAAGAIDYSFGPGRRTLTLPGVPAFSPLICYEAIFPGDVVAPGGVQPSWLLNLTNDSWFGATSGPYQHLAMARARSIETGLPMVRDANTGISAIISPYGQIISHLPLGVGGVLDSPLPKAIPNGTAFATYGNEIFALFIFCGILLIPLLGARRATR